MSGGLGEDNHQIGRMGCPCPSCHCVFRDICAHRAHRCCDCDARTMTCPQDVASNHAGHRAAAPCTCQACSCLYEFFCRQFCYCGCCRAMSDTENKTGEDGNTSNDPKETRSPSSRPDETCRCTACKCLGVTTCRRWCSCLCCTQSADTKVRGCKGEGLCPF